MPFAFPNNLISAKYIINLRLMKNPKPQLLSAIIHGLLNRWTSQYDWGITTGGLSFNLNNGTKTYLIIVKLLENTFLSMTKVRDWPILTLAMLSVKTEQIQNFALF